MAGCRKSRGFFLFLNLFILFLAALGLCGCTWVFLWLRRAGATLHCGAVFSLWWLLLLGARALGARASIVVARGLSSCGSRALERRLSSCGALPGLSCNAACGMFPDQGSNPCLLHWQVDSQPLRHQGSPRKSSFDCNQFGTGGEQNLERKEVYFWHLLSREHRSSFALCLIPPHCLESAALQSQASPVPT